MSLLDRRQSPGYGADVPVSVPKVPNNRPLVAMYGFAYNRYGICHDISEAELAELSVPKYAPFDPTSAHNRRGDDDVDGRA